MVSRTFSSMHPLKKKKKSFISFIIWILDEQSVSCFKPAALKLHWFVNIREKKKYLTTVNILPSVVHALKIWIQDFFSEILNFQMGKICHTQIPAISSGQKAPWGQHQCLEGWEGSRKGHGSGGDRGEKQYMNTAGWQSLC